MKTKKLSRLTSLLTALIIPFIGMADSIVLKDATVITAYNVEEAGRWVIYTLDESPESALQRIDIDKVFAIKGADGQMRTVGQNATDSPAKKEVVRQSPTPGQPVKTPTVAAADNQSLIQAYNSPVLKLKKPKKEQDKQKYCSDFLSIWGVTDNSILSDSNLVVNFIWHFPAASARLIMPQYKTIVTNKTDGPIYIDLANSFRFASDGTAKPMYNNAVYTEGTNGGHGASMNLGAVTGALGVGGAVGTLAQGLNIGGGSSKSASVSTTEERILMIPPHASVALPPMKWNDGNKLREDYETLYFRTKEFDGPLTADGDLRKADANKGYVHQVEKVDGLDNASITRDVLQAPLGWLREFTEDDTIKKSRRIICYSTSPSFDEYSTLEFSLYIRAVMGSNPMKYVPKDYSQKLLEVDDESHLLIGLGYVRK